MSTLDTARSALQEWRTVLGPEPTLGPEQPGRELWPVTAEDGRQYLLKRLGPWRNLPVADQARVLAHLARRGIRVAEFLITDRARVHAGTDHDCFVLLPWLVHDRLGPADALASEGVVGSSIAGLHQALADYPWSANSYRERIVEGLTGELLLPEDLLDPAARHLSNLVDRIEPLPVQLVHGDLTPDNVLVSRAARSVAFIDLDHLPLAPRTWDLAKYLSRRLRRLPPATALEHVSRCVAGYHRTSPLSEGELWALSALIAAMNLLEASWTARILSGRLKRRLLPAEKAELEPMLDALRRQFRHGEELDEAVRAGATRADSPARRR